MIIDDDSIIESVCYDRKVLIFGDSISQGYDCLRPSNRYGAKLSEKLNTEEVNKALG